MLSLCFAVVVLLPLVFATSNKDRAGLTCAVTPLGGGQDDGPNIIAAFKKCANGGTVVLDKSYVVDSHLITKGLKNVDVELSGVVQYTPNVAKWSLKSTYQAAKTFWYLSGQNIHVYGGGTIDGNGQVWWDYPKKSSNFVRPVLFTVGDSSQVLIEGLTYLGSPYWTNIVHQSDHVTYRHINISTVSSSSNPAKNSDGWDIYRSSFVTIEDSDITNDDDCVSFKPNSTNVLVNNLRCNGSHGISIGSLGQNAGETDIVANIYVSNIYMSNAQNGVRIKTYGGSPQSDSTTGGGTGYVKNVTYTNFQVENVDHPIIIDQCYFTDAKVCAQYPSKVTISDVHLDSITGTSSGKSGLVVVDLECSGECQDITAKNIALTSPKGKATYVCANIASTTELDFACTPPSSS